MRKNVKKLITSTLMVLGMLMLYVYTATASTITVTPKYDQASARSMLSLINNFRTGGDAWYWDAYWDDDEDTATFYKKYCSNLKPLKYDYELEKVAMQRAAEIAVFYSHTRPNGDKIATACNELGYTVWFSVAENLLAGPRTFDEAFNDWKEDDKPYDAQGHRRNMLSRAFQAVGIAHCTFNGFNYWVQVFSDNCASNTATTACSTKKAVKVSIDDSQITQKSISLGTSALSVTYGTSVKLPTPSGTMTLKDTWPNKPFPIECSASWTSANTACASISSGKVYGKKVGSTTLKASTVSGTISLPVTVKAASISGASVTLKNSTLTWKGSPVTPVISSVTLNGKTLVSGTDYKVSVSNNKLPGTGTLKITGCGNYTGSVSVRFSILPESTTLRSVSNISPKTIKVLWKTRSNIDGYQFFYYDGTTRTYIKYRNPKKAGTLIKNCKIGKSYKVKVRTFKKANGSYYYSAWSSLKTIKVVR